MLTSRSRIVAWRGLFALPLFFVHSCTTADPGLGSHDSQALNGTLAVAFALSEGTGTTTADSSGNGNTGTLQGAAWTTQGKYGDALSFAGSSYVKAAGGPNIDNLVPFTYCAWIHPVDMGGQRDGRILHKGSNTARKQLNLDDSTTNGFGLYVDRATSAAHAVSTNNVVPLNQWSYVCGTYSESDGPRLFVNATEVSYALRAVGSGTTTSDAVDGLYVGNRSTTDKGFDGTIDEVRVHDRILLATEMQTDMNTPIQSNLDGGSEAGSEAGSDASQDAGRDAGSDSGSDAGTCDGGMPPPPITMGDTRVLPNADSGNANLLVAQEASLPQAATTQTLSFYVTQAAGKLRLGLYDSTGPSGGPGAKVAETAEITPAAGWNTYGVLSPRLLPAGTYWLAYLPSDNNLGFVKTADGTSSGRDYTFPYGALPSTFSTSPASTPSHWSFYATLGVSGCVAQCTPMCSGKVCGSDGCGGLCGTCAPGMGCSPAGQCVAGLPGPLTQSTNPNYFRDTNGRNVVLAGSHTWNDLQDWGANGTPEPMDFTAYVNLLATHGHNFTLLWRTELATFCGLPSTATNPPNLATSMQPWLRTGPGVADDGLPKFDLTKPNQPYFDQLRSRVSQLNGAGVYAGVYLFTGEWLDAFRCSGDGYPLTGTNNVNAIDDGGGNASMTMTGPNAITAIQDAMVEKTIDTLNDLPNVLWIVSEESASNTMWWQNHMIGLVKSYESNKPQHHPVGLATVDGLTDQDLYNTNADWVAPVSGLSPTSSCGTGTPACKVNVNDSDHSYFGMWNDTPQQNRNFAWQNFARGNNVLFMDPYEVYYPRENRNLCVSPVNQICSGPDPRWENFRSNLGYILSYSRKLDMNAVLPSTSVCSTQYCLAQTPPVGTEVLVYAPNGGTFTVDLSHAAGRTMNYEWFDPSTGHVVSTGSVPGGNASQSFTTPGGIGGDSVLYVVDSAGHG